MKDIEKFSLFENNEEINTTIRKVLNNMKNVDKAIVNSTSTRGVLAFKITIKFSDKASGEDVSSVFNQFTNSTIQTIKYLEKQKQLLITCFREQK